MGWYPTTYIGPYVEVTVEREWKERTRCSTPADCPSADLPAGQFCSKCGQKTPITDKVFRPRLGPYDILDDINEALMPEETDDEGCDTDPEVKFRYVPNQDRKGVKSIRRNGQETRAYDLSSIDTVAEMKAFKSAFKEELEAMHKLFGNATVKWGVIFSGG